MYGSDRRLAARWSALRRRVSWEGAKLEGLRSLNVGVNVDVDDVDCSVVFLVIDGRL